MKVTDSIPMPRVRVQQVTPEAFADLLARVEALEAQAAEKKRGRPAKEKDNGDSDQ